MGVISRWTIAGIFGLALLARGDLVIVHRVEAGKQSGTITMRIQGEKTRLDMGSEVSTISDSRSGEEITLMHGRKVFMKIAKEQAEVLKERMRKMQPAEGSKLVPAGRQEKIESYDCDVYLWSSASMRARYWIAREFPDSARIAEQMAASMDGGLVELGPKWSELPGIVVKMEMSVGRQKVTTTLVSISEEKLDPALFSVPGEYQETVSPTFEFSK